MLQTNRHTDADERFTTAIVVSVSNNNNNNNDDFHVNWFKGAVQVQYLKYSTVIAAAYTVNTQSNKWVFKADLGLKLDSELEFLTVVGRLFHVKGPAIARSLNVALIYDVTEVVQQTGDHAFK